MTPLQQKIIEIVRERDSYLPVVKQQSLGVLVENIEDLFIQQQKEIVEDLEKWLSGMGYGNRNSGMAIGYDHAIKDILSHLNTLKE